MSGTMNMMPLDSLAAVGITTPGAVGQTPSPLLGSLAAAPTTAPFSPTPAQNPDAQTSVLPAPAAALAGGSGPSPVTNPIAAVNGPNAFAPPAGGLYAGSPSVNPPQDDTGKPGSSYVPPSLYGGETPPLMGTQGGPAQAASVQQAGQAALATAAGAMAPSGPPAAPPASPNAPQGPPPGPLPQAGAPPSGPATGMYEANNGPAATTPPSTPSSAPPLMPPQDYSAITPPPAALAPLVAQAAQKYGVPPNVLQWVGTHESNWDPSATGPNTAPGEQTTGIGQFKAATAQALGIDPKNPAQSIDGMAHYLRQLYDQNPSGGWEGAVQKYGTFSTGRGPEQDAAVQGGFRKMMGTGAVPPTVPTSGAPTTPQGTPQQPGLNVDPALVATARSLMGNVPRAGEMADMNSRNRMLALASGLLQGPTLGKGLGKGLEGMIGVDQAATANRFKAADMGAQLSELGIRGAYMQGMLGNAGRRIDQGQQRIDFNQGPGKVGQQGELDAQKQAIPAANKEVQELQSTRGDDAQALRNNQVAIYEAEQNPQLMGPTLAARANRALVEMGVAGDPNTLAVLKKATTDQRNEYLRSLTGGHVGGIRSNQELKNLSEAVANVDTSPEAARYILQQQQWEVGERNAWRDQVAQMQQQAPQSVQGQNYFTSRDQFTKNYLTQHPLPSYGTQDVNQLNATATSTKPLTSFWR